jgi:hypothetical protein
MENSRGPSHTVTRIKYGKLIKNRKIYCAAKIYYLNVDVPTWESDAKSTIFKNAIRAILSWNVLNKKQ